MTLPSIRMHRRRARVNELCQEDQRWYYIRSYNFTFPLPVRPTKRKPCESTAIGGTWDYSPIPTRSPDLTLKEILFRTFGPF